MAAVIFDLVLDQGRDNAINMRWLDKDDNPVDLTNHGAVAEIRTVQGELISRITTAGQNLILLTPAPADPTFATDAGKITINFPAKDLLNPPSLKGEWELVIYPDASQPKVNPQSLLRGNVQFRKMVARIDE